MLGRGARQKTLMILSRKLQTLKAATASSGCFFATVRCVCQRLSPNLVVSGAPAENLAEAQNTTRFGFAALSVVGTAEQLHVQVPSIQRPLHRAGELLRVFGRPGPVRVVHGRFRAGAMMNSY